MTTWTNSDGLKVRFAREEATVNLDSGTVHEAYQDNDQLFDVTDYGAKGDGSTDDTASITAAITAAVAKGGGTVTFPVGTFMTSGITLYSNIYLRGAGHNTTFIKLKAGSNATVIEGQNFQTWTGTNTSSSILGWGVCDLTVDGNSSNNTSPGATAGHGIAVYGRHFIIDNVYIKNTYRTGLFTEYATGAVGSSPYNGRVSRMSTNTTGEHGWYNQVSDLHATDINIRSASCNTDNTYDAIYLGSTGGIRGNNINIWSAGDAAAWPRYGINIQASGTTLNGVHVETSKTAAVYILGNRCSLSGFYTYNILSGTHVYVIGNGVYVDAACDGGGIGSSTAVPLTLGINGTTPLGCNIQLRIVSFTGNVVDPTYSGGNNHIYITGYQTAGALTSASMPSTDRLYSDIAGGFLSAAFGGRTANAIAIGAAATAATSGGIAIGPTANAAQNTSWAIGSTVTANNNASFARGSRCTTTVYGEDAFANGMFSVAGDNMMRNITWRGTTSNNTATEIFCDGGAASARAALSNNSSWLFDIHVVGRTTTGGSDRMFRRIIGAIVRGANAASTTITGTNSVTDINLPAGWDATATADTTNGSLKITVTGENSKTIRWYVTARVTHLTD